ncbi:hypothetical protein V3C99_015631 [Haemonchus contortus]
MVRLLNQSSGRKECYFLYPLSEEVPLTIPARDRERHYIPVTVPVPAALTYSAGVRKPDGSDSKSVERGDKMKSKIELRGITRSVNQGAHVTLLLK